MSPYEIATALCLIVGSLFVYAAVKVYEHRKPRPRRAGATPTTGGGSKPGQCDSTGCGYPATVLVVEAADLGGDTRLVCRGCADKGAAYRWWEFVGDAS